MDFSKFVVKNNVKESRLLEGYTKKQLADKVGCSVATISRIESGSCPDIHLAFRISWAFGSDFEEMFYLKRVEE